MLAPSIVALSLSATTLAAVVVPENYNKVYLQSLVDTSFVVQAKGVTTGSTVVVWVSLLIRFFCLSITYMYIYVCVYVIPSC